MIFDQTPRLGAYCLLILDCRFWIYHGIEHRERSQESVARREKHSLYFCLLDYFFSSPSLHSSGCSAQESLTSVLRLLTSDPVSLVLPDMPSRFTPCPMLYATATGFCRFALSPAPFTLCPFLSQPQPHIVGFIQGNIFFVYSSRNLRKDYS
jgi:hypothetical protein